MTDREKLIELLKVPIHPLVGADPAEVVADYLLDNGVTLPPEPRPLDDWGEDYGDALWWKFPIEEPPYVGSPLDVNWPDYHTHWTPILVPQPPREE